MSTLKETLHADLTEAIRSRNAVVAATLRMALTAISTAETAGTTHRELSDDEVLKVLVKEGKKRREAAAAYTGAGRPELAARDEEIAALVAQALAQTGASGMPQLGLVMKAVQPLVAGRADGGRVAAAVRAALTAG